MVWLKSAPTPPPTLPEEGFFFQNSSQQETTTTTCSAEPCHSSTPCVMLGSMPMCQCANGQLVGINEDCPTDHEAHLNQDSDSCMTPSGSPIECTSGSACVVRGVKGNPEPMCLCGEYTGTPGVYGLPIRGVCQDLCNGARVYPCGVGAPCRMKDGRAGRACPPIGIGYSVCS